MRKMFTRHCCKTRDKKGWHTYYICGNFTRTKQCNRNLVRSKEAEEAVIDKIKTFVDATDDLPALIKSRMKSTVDVPELKAQVKILEDRLRILKQQQNKAKNDMYNLEKLKELGEEFLFLLLKEKNAEIEKIELDVSELKKKIDICSKEEINIEK